MKTSLATVAAFMLATTMTIAQTTAPAPAPSTSATPPTTSATLEPGANSFTEGQAKARFEEAGLTDIADLRKDDQGIWRARAKKDGRDVTAGLDFKGNINIQ
jgi:putative membrane protein